VGPKQYVTEVDNLRICQLKQVPDAVFLDAVLRSDVTSSRSPNDGSERTRCGYYERATADVRRSSEVAIRRCNLQGSEKVEAGRASW